MCPPTICKETPYYANGDSICKLISFFEFLDSIYLHMGICIWGFAHEKSNANGDPHMQNCLKKQILDCLFLHMEFVCTWGDYKFPVVPFRRDPLQTGTMRLYPRHRTDS